jgi:hypothetical protein
MLKGALKYYGTSTIAKFFGTEMCRKSLKLRSPSDMLDSEVKQ